MRANELIALTLFITINAAEAADRPNDVTLHAVITGAISTEQATMHWCGLGYALSQVQSVTLVKYGDYNSSNKYWPARVSVVGQCTWKFGPSRHQFSGTADFQVVKNDFGEWFARPITMPVVQKTPLSSTTTRTGPPSPSAQPSPPQQVEERSRSLDPALAFASTKVDAQATTITTSGFSGLKVGHTKADAEIFFQGAIVEEEICEPNPAWVLLFPKANRDTELYSTHGRIVGFRVMSANYTTRAGLKIGDPEAKIQRLFATDTSLTRKEISSSIVRYTLGANGPTSITFTVRDGAVVEMIFGSSRVIDRIGQLC